MCCKKRTLPENPPSFDAANWFERLTLSYLTPVIGFGNLQPDEVPLLPKYMKAEYLGRELEKNWNDSLKSTLWKTFGFEFMLGLPLFFVLTAAQWIIPFLIQALLRYVQNPALYARDPFWGLSDGYKILGVTVVFLLFQAVALNTAFLFSTVIATKMRSGIAILVYRKSLRISVSSKASLSSGDILNLMSQDAERIFNYFFVGHGLAYGFMMIVSLLVILIVQFGAAVGFSAVAVAVVLLPIATKVAQLVGYHKRMMLGFTDERVSFMSEVMTGITTVKSQAWEDHVSHRVDSIRKKEMGFGRNVLWLLATNSWIAYCLPTLMSATVFGVYSVTSGGVVMSSATIYSILVFMNYLTLPLDVIPRAAGALAQALVSIRRVEAFLRLEDRADLMLAPFSTPTTADTVDNHGEPDEDWVIKLDRVDLAWTRFTVPMLAAAEVQDEEEEEAAGKQSSFRSFTKMGALKSEKSKILKSERYLPRAQEGKARAPKSRRARAAESPGAPAPGKLNWRLKNLGVSFRDVTRPEIPQDELPSPRGGAHGSSATEVESSSRTVLHDVALTVKRGELLVVVGRVGTGKSTLLMSMLGELAPSSGVLMHNFRDLKQSVAYAPQESFILNASVKENIVFGNDGNPALYDSVISAAQLIPDIASLPIGDQTEIGSRGVNLSGGQRARIGAARALYSAMEHPDPHSLVLLDDPFSALDSTVATAMWHEAVETLLKGKTRVVALNSNLHLLAKADRVVVLEDGVLAAVGTPESMFRQFSWLVDLREAHAQEHEEKASAPPPAPEPIVTPLIPEVLPSTETHHLKRRVDHSVTMTRNVETDMDEAAVAGTQSGDVFPEKSEDSNDEENPPRREVAPAVEAAATTPQGKLYTAEERNKGNVSMATYWHWLGSGTPVVFKRCAREMAPLLPLLLVLCLYVGSHGLKLYSELYIGFEGLSRLGPYFGIIGGMIVLALMRTIVFTMLSARASRVLHDELVRTLMGAPVATFFDVTPIGRILNRLSSDIDAMDTRLPEVFLQLLNAMSTILGALVVAAVSSPYFLLVLIPLGFIFGFVASTFARTSRQVKRLETVSRSPLFSHFGETIAGLTTIRAFARNESFRDQNSALVNANARNHFFFWFASRWFALRVDMISIITQIVITCLVVGITAAVEPEPNADPSVATTAGALGSLAIVASLSLTTTVQAGTRFVIETENAMVSCERIADLVKKCPQERTSGGDVSPPDSDDGRPGVEVRFEHVTARYRPHLEPSVRDVTFTVPAGSRVGLCGRTGSGKSTTVSLLLGMLGNLDGGRIMLGRDDLASLNLSSMRKRFAVVPQVPTIFSGTVRFTLDPWGDCRGDDERLWSALRSVSMDQVVRNLGSGKEGLDAMVDEAGANFSVGERQLLCLARALLRDAMVVIIDEGTASLDAESDVVAQRAISQGFKGSTVFIIAHRIHTIVDCDQVVVLDKGRVVEVGNPRDLIREAQQAELNGTTPPTGGWFATLWKASNAATSGV